MNQLEKVLKSKRAKSSNQRKANTPTLSKQSGSLKIKKNKAKKSKSE